MPVLLYLWARVYGKATVLWMLIYATLILLEIDVCSVRLMCCINAVFCNVNTCSIQFDQ